MKGEVMLGYMYVCMYLEKNGVARGKILIDEFEFELFVHLMRVCCFLGRVELNRPEMVSSGCSMRYAVNNVVVAYNGVDDSLASAV